MTTHTYFVCLRTLVLMAAVAAQVQCARTSADDQVALTIGSQRFTLAEVDRKWTEIDPASRMQARQQLYDGRTRALEQLIAEQIIEREARAKGMTPDHLVQTEIPKRVAPVTDEDIAAAFRDAGDQTKGATLEELKPRIQEYLQEQRYAAALRVFVADLRKQASDVHVTLEPPRLQVAATQGDPIRGPVRAPVTIIEFSDFQCPFCKQAGPTLKKIQETFGDRVRLVYKDSPLSIHPDAFLAAEAAQCAHEQNRFWEYHDVLFANQQALERPRLNEYALRAGLDLANFSTCLETGRFRGSVEQDLSASQAYGVSSTPTFFINGRMLMGAVPYDTFEQVIREELARSE